MPGIEQTNTTSHTVSWRCPSNIAIVKYWGKKDNQIPCNASLSMTLSQAYTETTLTFSNKKTVGEIEMDYYFEGKKHLSFEERIKKYLKDQHGYFPILEHHAIKIESQNSFPHSAGIASSASAFGALALALLDASGTGTKDKEFLKRASQLARLGSGSACRSVYGGYSVWGYVDSVPGSSDEFATPLADVHDNFKKLHDAIIIVDDRAKAVSSSLGHSLMKGHPYAETRFKQANSRVADLVKILGAGDYESFIKLAESEALTLHAMMMTSSDYYLLLKPGSLVAIDKIQAFRRDTNIPICFTLDAGPNLHVLYPDAYRDKVEDFLKFSFDNIIFDTIGTGPEKLR